MIEKLCENIDVGFNGLKDKNYNVDDQQKADLLNDYLRSRL